MQDSHWLTGIELSEPLCALKYPPSHQSPSTYSIPIIVIIIINHKVYCRGHQMHLQLQLPATVPHTVQRTTHSNMYLCF